MKLRIEELAEDLSHAAKCVRIVGDIRGARQRYRALASEDYMDAYKMNLHLQEYVAAVDRALA